MSQTAALPAGAAIADLFKGAMRRLAASVTVITASHQDRRGGMTATAVCSVSVVPPLLLVCVNRQGSTHPLIRDSGRFAVNLLAAGQDAVAGAFARSALSGEDQFDVAGIWSPAPGGMPLLAGAAATLVCRVETTVEAGSHTVFIGAVEAVHLPEPAPEALVYAAGGYKRLM
ncbi:MAG: flavin reductase [Alphaproteobacteria bacterium]|nr:flavin reductase [Alphaproteobacteria bacterium]